MANKIMRKVFLACAIIISIVYVSMYYDNGEYTKGNINEYVCKIYEIYNVPGLSVAIIDGDNEYYINYGESIDENSRFELGSTTKAFTALGILKLEQEGKLKITDSVSDYLPWFKPTYKRTAYDVSIEDLLCHTSGVPSWTISTIPEGEDIDESLLIRTIQNIQEIKLDSEPGTYHEYATINYDILALIIEEVSGEKYEDFISSEILTPLDMQDSFFRTNDEDADKMVRGHKTGFFSPFVYDSPTYYGNTAAGYLVSNTSDLMKWMKNWSIESQDELGLVKDVLNYDVSEKGNYYAGWNIYEGYICHGGNNPNFSSQVIISREKRQGVFVLSNLAGSSATNIGDGIYRLLLGDTIRIGLQTDTNGLVDFLSIVMALLLIYFTMLLWDRKSPRACIVRVTVGTASIVAMLIVPFIFHYPYKVIYVWFPVTVCMTLTITLTIALINIFAGCFWWFRDKMGS